MDAGRAGEQAAQGLTEALEGLGFETNRLKTGTPPRLDGRTIKYEKLEEQFADDDYSLDKDDDFDDPLMKDFDEKK